MKTAFKIIALLFVAVSVRAQEADTVIGAKGEVFMKRVVAAQLSDPWEITYGPDNGLWVTESKGYTVDKIDAATGAKKVILNLNSLKDFDRYDKNKSGKPWPQGGLMGMALHPNLLNGQPFVYLAYVYHFKGANAAGDGCEPNFGGCFFTTRIVRYKYDPVKDTLINPEIICDTVPASSDHNGGRLLIAPIEGKSYLFYSIGEMGAGQFNNAGRPNHAQDINAYQGKVLRFNLEPDDDTNGLDKWVPNNNPFNGATQNAVFSYGHRNPEGLVYGVVNGTGRIYEAEHGPFSDDEVNIIEMGKNYGHPLVIGFNDGNYNGLAAGATEHKTLPGKWQTSYPYIKDEQQNASAMGEEYRNPLIALYPNSNTFLTRVLSETKEGLHPEWPSEAPSSIDIYTKSTIPGWQNSLLLSTLKTGRLVRLKLNDNGDKIEGDTINYFKDNVRYRDIALSPDGRKIYLAIDSSATSSGPSKTKAKQSSCSGCIVEFSYQYQTVDAKKDD